MHLTTLNKGCVSIQTWMKWVRLFLYSTMESLPAQTEVIKREYRRLIKVSSTIIKDAWENLEVLVDWKDVQLVTIFKKRDRQGCGYHYGTLLLSILGKVFGHILLNRLLTLAEDFLPELYVGSTQTKELQTWSCAPQHDICRNHKNFWHWTEKHSGIFYGNWGQSGQEENF